MKLNPATVLVFSMFGSFAVILGVMILFFRPEPGPVRQVGQAETPERSPVSRAVPDSVAMPQPSKPEAKTSESAPGHPAGRARAHPPPALPAAPKRKNGPGRQTYRRIQQEQKEMDRLKAETEKHLEKRLAIDNQKIALLARQCEKLEPGEAVQVLRELDDATIARVLGHMNRKTALEIAALFKRLGRNRAAAIH